MKRQKTEGIDTTIQGVFYPEVNERGEYPLVDSEDPESPSDVRNDIAATVTIDGPVVPPESEDYKNLLR